MRLSPAVFGLLIFGFTTGGEWIALTLARRAFDSGAWPWALVALILGFTFERGAVAAWLCRLGVDDPDLRLPSKWRIAFVLVAATLAEILIWYGWRLSAAKWNVEIAGVWLFVAIHWLHVREIAEVRQQPMVSIAFRPRPLLVSLSETLAATLWLSLAANGHEWLGGIALFVGLGVEHTLQGMELKQVQTQTVQAFGVT